MAVGNDVSENILLDLQVIYIKAVVVLLLVWRILTIGIFGQVVGGVLSATLAYCLSRRSSSVPKQVLPLPFCIFAKKTSAFSKGSCRRLSVRVRSYRC